MTQKEIDYLTSLANTPELKVLLDSWLEGRCGYPDCPEVGECHRQNTAYVDDFSNWACYCPEHWLENDKYWDGMWKDYYQGALMPPNYGEE